MLKMLTLFQKLLTVLNPVCVKLILKVFAALCNRKMQDLVKFGRH